MVFRNFWIWARYVERCKKYDFNKNLKYNCEKSSLYSNMPVERRWEMFAVARELQTSSYFAAVVFYAIQAIALFKIGEKANIKNRWVAFIPFVQIIVLLHVIDKSGWAIFLLLIPIVNIVLGIIWFVKFYLAFKVNAGLIVLSIIIPIVNLVMMLVVAFSDQFKYGGNTRFTEA